ncbi:putative rootletin-like [Triplophysa rosa]|uniref:Rootletin-like n=1 Tax=Triplophysa rosa TaxID=992332 RepID=A0A9W7W8V2_TRIRA|nr:putative rootletin-like [Triplophysa rosa]
MDMHQQRDEKLEHSQASEECVEAENRRMKEICEAAEARVNRLQLTRQGLEGELQSLQDFRRELGESEARTAFLKLMVTALAHYELQETQLMEQLQAKTASLSDSNIVQTLCKDNILHNKTQNKEWLAEQVTALQATAHRLETGKAELKRILIRLGKERSSPKRTGEKETFALQSELEAVEKQIQDLEADMAARMLCNVSAVSYLYPRRNSLPEELHRQELDLETELMRDSQQQVEKVVEGCEKAHRQRVYCLEEQFDQIYKRQKQLYDYFRKQASPWRCAEGRNYSTSTQYVIALSLHNC